MLGSFLTQWTIRLALACLVAYFVGRMLSLAEAGTAVKTVAAGRKFALLRWIWTVGCGLFLAHVACAFQFTHHWSHEHAWRHTADETQRLMGFSFGDGIYFSYFFALLWLGDVICQWLRISLPNWLLLTAYLFMFFIALNGAIVFEDGPTRPVGAVVVVALLPLVIWFVWRCAAKRTLEKAEIAAAELET